MVVYWCADQTFQTHPVIGFFNTETERTQNTRIRGIYHELTVENWNPHGLHLQPQGFDLRHELLWILTGLMIWTLDLWVQHREFIGFHRKKHRANQKNKPEKTNQGKNKNKAIKNKKKTTRQQNKKEKKLRKMQFFFVFFLVTLPVELFFGDSVFDCFFFLIFC